MASNDDEELEEDEGKKVNGEIQYKPGRRKVPCFSHHSPHVRPALFPTMLRLKWERRPENVLFVMREALPASLTEKVEQVAKWLVEKCGMNVLADTNKELPSLPEFEGIAKVPPTFL